MLVSSLEVVLNTYLWMEFNVITWCFHLLLLSVEQLTCSNSALDWKPSLLGPNIAVPWNQPITGGRQSLGACTLALTFHRRENPDYLCENAFLGREQSHRNYRANIHGGKKGWLGVSAEAERKGPRAGVLHLGQRLGEAEGRKSRPWG